MVKRRNEDREKLECRRLRGDRRLWSIFLSLRSFSPKFFCLEKYSVRIAISAIRRDSATAISL